MKSTNELKDALLESAVHVVAQHGLEKTTTKLIASDAHVNEVYIYRCYENKDALLKAAFHAEDIRLADPVHKTMPVMRTVGLSWKERCFLLWKPCWEFILHKPDNCRFYLQYYYSASCRQYAYEEHLSFYRPLVEEIRPVFRPETNVGMLLHQIFDTMLSFASRVLSGEVENSEKTAKRTFEQIYNFYIILCVPTQEKISITDNNNVLLSAEKVHGKVCKAKNGGNIPIDE